MKKKAVSLFLAICILFGLVPALSITASAAKEGIFTYTVSNGEATITDCDNSARGAITIPSKLEGYPVTSIGDSAFEDCESLTSITIPDSVTSIGDYAFCLCESLTSITIPDSVTSIGYSAFEYCESLTSITIPDSVTSIGDSAFGGCINLTSITIPDSVTSIGNYVFNGCSSLTSITIPDSVTSIGSSAFRWCESLTSITIPDSVTSIGDYAFEDCYSLTSINVSTSNQYYTSVDGNLFNKDKTVLIQYAIGKADETYSIPDSVTSIGDSAFCWCESLTSITIPDSVTSIGDSAFGSCINLTSITIPDSVTSIGYRTFAYCYSLTSITIPDSVTSIGDSAFCWCESLTSITIPDSVTSIGDITFAYCESLTSITISDSVTSIGDRAFGSCINLTSITIPDSVTSIGDFAFHACESLTSITISDSVTSIGKGAFEYCDSLKAVYYSGSEEEWNKIFIGSGNTPLTNATIHYKDIPAQDEPSYEFDPSYVPETVNEVTINGRGKAYGRFLVKNTDGTVAKNKAVYYSVNGSGKKSKRTDKYGYLTVETDTISKSTELTVGISGSGIETTTGVLKVTVEPLHFKSIYEATFTKGATAALGIGVGGSIGKLEAEAQAAEIGASGSNAKSLSFSQEYANNKFNVAITAKQNFEAAIEAKAGLFAETNLVDTASLKASLGEISGGGSLGSTMGVSFQDEDFNINNADDVSDFSKFMLSAMLLSLDSNVATRYLMDVIDAPVNSYESGSTASLFGGASLGVIEGKLGGGVEPEVTLAGIGGRSVWSNSAVTNKDNSKEYTSSLTAEMGTSFLDCSVGYKEDYEVSTNLMGVKNNGTVEFSADRDKDGNLKEIGFSSKSSVDSSIFWSKKVVDKNETISYTDENAVKVASKNEDLSKFSNGEKGYFSLSQMKGARNAIINSDVQGKYSATEEHTKGIDVDLSASVQLFLKIGGKIGISGVESYEFESKNGIYDKNTIFVQAKNDIKDDVENQFIGVADLVDMIKSDMSSLLSEFWDSVEGFISDVGEGIVKAGNAVVKGVSNAGKWVVSIIKPTESVKTMSLLAVDNEMSLFSTSSLATTVGDPYIISITDENGNEITAFSDNPLMLTLTYTQDQLYAANVVDIGDIAILRWDEDKCVYVKMGGELDAENMCVNLEITKPGQYILAVDNCPPAITQFLANSSGMSPEISAVVSDMSGLREFSFSINGEEAVNMQNLEEYYDFTTGKFLYKTSGLTAGSYTAVISASDTFGNSIEEEITFTVQDAVPVISDVSLLPDTADKSTTVSATVEGEEITQVFLNLEVTDIYGDSRSLSVEMTENDGTYSANIPDIQSGYAITAWINAYNTYGNCAQSEKQQSVIMPDGKESAIAVTKIDDSSVTIMCKDEDSVTGAKVYLAVYDEYGTLKQIKSADAATTVTFDGVETDKTLKAFMWESISPRSEIATITVK